jgi:hypothetical protein
VRAGRSFENRRKSFKELLEKYKRYEEY